MRTRADRLPRQDIVKLINAAANRKADVSELKAKLLSLLRSVDEFAYTRQKSELMPSMASGYCAPGVVPRDRPGACKVRPSVDYAGQKAMLTVRLPG